ncbi:MAG: hypothetical protein HKP01_07855, partial [Gemmatimonadetes bacterium]|nr:hypothetical protein [Gemmatimonadota bacterium]
MTPFPRDSGVQITAASTTLLRAVVVFVCLLGLPTDAVSQDLDTSLIQAAARGDLAAVQMMLAEGADAAATDSSGASAFMWGAYAGSVPVARALMDAGADPFRKGVIWLDESRRSYYGSPLAAAAGEGWLPSVRFLIEEIGLSVNDREWSPTDGEATGWTALQWAVSSDQIDIVRYLAARGADLEVRNRNGEPLLVAYADPGRLPVLKVLLEAGADVNATDPAGNSVLLYAMIADATEFVELLLSYGADPNRVRSDGATPLLFGIVNYATASVLQMLDRDIDLHRAGEYGTTPLHWAAMAGVPEVIDKMIVRGADLNVRDSTGATPLGHAAQASRYRAAETLLSRGADPSARESNGWAPLHYAAQNGHSRLIRALIDAGAEIDARSNNGLRPLDIAIDSLVIPPVEVLVCAGASLDMPDAQGRTPVERARHREREDLARDARLGGWTEQERQEAEEYYVSMSTMLADPYCGVRLRTGMVANNDRFMSVGGVIVARQVMETILSQERLRLGEVQEGYAYLLAHFLWVHVEGGDRNEGLRLGERALELHRQLYQPDAPEMARVFAPLAALHLRDDQEVSQHYVQQGLRLTETSAEEWLPPRLLRTSARLLLD